jgi:protocatechuate 3,4-dioxygenase beta subunit
MKAIESIALLCLVAATFAFAADGWIGGTHAIVTAKPANGPSQPEETSTRELEQRGNRVLATPTAEQGDLGARAPQDGFRLAGRVRGADGEGISDAVVTLMTADGVLMAAPSAVGPAGDFEWSGLPQRLFRVQASARNVQGEVLVAAPDDDVQLRLPLRDGERSIAFAVRVIDGLGAPVAGAAVEAIGEFSPPGPRHGVTDAGGICRFEGSPCSSAVITARTTDGRLGCHVEAPGGAAVVQVTVNVPGTMCGTVEVPGAVSLPAGASIVALLGEISPLQRGHCIRFVAPIVGNRYRFDSLPAGVYAVCVAGADAPGVFAYRHDATNSVIPSSPVEQPAPVRAAVTAGTATQCDLHLAIGSAVEGNVCDELGRPLANVALDCERLVANWRPRHEARLRGCLVEPAKAPSGEMHPAYGHPTTTDQLGRYRLSGLVPGDYRLSVRLPGRVAAEERAVLVQSGRPQRMDFVLAMSGALEGTVGHGAVVILQAANGAAIRARETDANGLFRFAGVAAGHYELSVVESSALQRSRKMSDAPTLALAKVVVAPGLTSFSDLREALPVTMFGRILGTTVFPDCIRVSLGNCGTSVDQEGRFTLRLASPIHAQDRLLVTASGVTSELPLPVTARGARTFAADFHMARRSTTLRALAANGLPIGAVVTLSGTATGTLRIDPGTDFTVGLPMLPIAARIEFDDGSVAEQLLDGGGVIMLIAPASGAIHVQVTDEKGRPRSGASVQAITCMRSANAPAAFALDDDAGEAIEGVTDAAGRVTLRGVRSGDVLVQIGPTFDSPESYAGNRLRLAAGQSFHVHLTSR